MDKLWVTLMGLTDKAFNKNFFIAVVLTFIFLFLAVSTLYVKEIAKNEKLQKEFAVTLAQCEKEKITIKNQSDSIRNVDYRFFEKKTDSISRVVYRLLTKEEIKDLN